MTIQTWWNPAYSRPDNPVQRADFDDPDAYNQTGRAHSMVYALVLESPKPSCEIQQAMGLTRERTNSILEDLMAQGLIGYDWELRTGHKARKVWKGAE